MQIPEERVTEIEDGQAEIIQSENKKNPIWTTKRKKVGGKKKE